LDLRLPSAIAEREGGAILDFGFTILDLRLPSVIDFDLGLPIDFWG